jgi:NADH-quinone oxidoreductase subunit A
MGQRFRRWGAVGEAGYPVQNLTLDSGETTLKEYPFGVPNLRRVELVMQSHPYSWNYIPLMLQVLAAVGLAAGMAVVSWFIGRHRNTKTKLAAYECGIPAEGDARGRFSVRFYMVAMLFILFDVEAVFMFPWAIIYRRLPEITGSRFFGFWEIVVYLAFVLVGFFYIWKKGILDWGLDKTDL